MDKTDIVVATATAAATKKAAVSSILFSSMVIFDDPAYIITASVGGFVSMTMAYYDFMNLKAQVEASGKRCIKRMHLELLRAFVVGLIFSLLSFTLMLSSGESIIAHFFDSDIVLGSLPSIWMVLTLIIAINSDGIYMRVKNLIGGKK